MAWTAVTPITAGVPVPKASFFDPVSTDLNVLGNAWTADPRASSAIWTTSGASVGDGTLVSRYRLAGKTLDWLLTLTFGAGTAPGAAQFAFAYPAGVSVLNAGAVVHARYFDFSATNTYAGHGVVNTATVNLQAIASAIGLMANVNSSTPFTWGTGDAVGFLLTGCEVA